MNKNKRITESNGFIEHFNIMFSFQVSSQIGEVFKLFRTNFTFIHLISMFCFLVPFQILFSLVNMITLIAFMRIWLANYFSSINTYFYVMNFCYMPPQWCTPDIQTTILAFYIMLILVSVICSVCSVSVKVCEFFTLKTFTKQWQMLFLDMVW